MSRPSISVIVTCYNLGAYLPEALDSVCGVGAVDAEVVLVDDGSTDARTLEEVDRAGARGVRVIRQSNQGLAAARNAGIQAARSDNLLPLDADNRLRPLFLQRAVATLNANPKVGVVYGDAEYFGERNGRWEVGPFDLHRMLRWNYIDACAAFRREVWSGHGGYDGRMPVMGLEDWDFWLGAASRGWEFQYFPEVFFDYRVRGGSMIAATKGAEGAVAAYVAKKHGLLYRDAFLKLVDERNLQRGGIGRLLKRTAAGIRNRLR